MLLSFIKSLQLKEFFIRNQQPDRSNIMAAGIINATDGDFQSSVLQADKPVLVDFWAPWCGPCKALTPILDEIASEKGDSVGVYKVNVDENTDLAQEQGVQSIPTILIYKNGSLSEKMIGLKSKDELIEAIS